jgi:UDP-N-acetylmuramate dehydrogenase
MLFRLLAIPNLNFYVNASLAGHTRFEIGGPARLLADASTETALIETLRAIEESGWRHTVIGGGTNLIVDDAGFYGAVVRYTAHAIEIDGATVRVEAGVVLQDLVDATIASGLRGLETMTGIPGWVGGAVYGNAGAYGHSINERVVSVRFFDGSHIHETQEIREIDNSACEFRYRESIFKRKKDWVILSATLRLDPANADDLRAASESILKIRNAKYPPTMRCAGSIFKNLMLADLPESARVRVPNEVVREGKVPSAYFLEQAGAKGMSRGGIRVADYHANLIYNDVDNDGGGTARELRDLIAELKQRVRDQFGIELEEEVQYVGNEPRPKGAVK